MVTIIVGKEGLLSSPRDESNCFHFQVAVGDQDGVLQVFSIKNDEIQLTFKTLPGEPITSVHLGGSSPGTLYSIGDCKNYYLNNIK